MTATSRTISKATCTDCGSVAVETGRDLAFAKRYDPQSYSYRSAGGQALAIRRSDRQWLDTAALMMRLYVEHYLTHMASLASPGLDELRWLKPVRPGDRLTVRVTVLKAAPRESKADRGVGDLLHRGLQSGR